MPAVQHQEFPKIDGEIDDLKAIEFAQRVLQWFGPGKPDCTQAGIALGNLLRTAMGFETSQMERFAAIEDMLRADGCSVVIYLEGKRVRDALARKHRPDLALNLSEGRIGAELQAMMQVEAMPQPLMEWVQQLEETAADRLIATAA